MQGNRKTHLITVRPEVYILLAVAAFILPLGWILAWVTAAVFHEFFHYVALRICRCDVNSIQVGVNGAVMNTPCMPYSKEAICAIAGPLAGFVLLFVARWMPKVAVCGFLQSLYNLLPIYPMDGGRVLRSLAQSWFDFHIAANICKWIERLVLCVLCGICLYLTFAASLGPVPLIWISGLIFKNKFINSPCKQWQLRVQ